MTFNIERLITMTNGTIFLVVQSTHNVLGVACVFHQQDQAHRGGGVGLLFLLSRPGANLEGKERRLKRRPIFFCKRKSVVRSLSKRPGK